MAEVPPKETLDELAHRLRRAWKAGRLDWISERDWATAAFVLWRGEPMLAVDRHFLEAYLGHVARLKRRRPVRLLISAYLRAFDENLPGLGPVAEVLRRLAPNWRWAWTARNRKFRLFDPEQAPQRLMAACLAAEDPRSVESGLGLEHLEEEGIVLAAKLHAVRQLECDLAAGRHASVHFDRHFGWFTSELGIAARLRGPLADALLRPWLKQPVPDEIKPRIQDFLLGHYGDPRTRPGRWGAVSDEAKRVFRRWLTRVALAQFLEVIDQLAVAHQWKYRRAFWTAYFDRDFVWDARVAFGKDCALLARKLFGRDAPFATLMSGSRIIERSHAVLLMRIGSLTIADWSHNGKWVIWRKANSSKPSLEQTRYKSDEVSWLGADASGAHYWAVKYAWQRKVRDFIDAETGVRLRDRDFGVGQP